MFSLINIVIYIYIYIGPALSNPDMIEMLIIQIDQWTAEL